ncbi:MAG: hypothetical protein IGS39_03360 [Calothrix sp. C42_A2020_038]|nr:hypothetical protein [Calothrix sp. C42_A2020_038]
MESKKSFSLTIQSKLYSLHTARRILYLALFVIVLVAVLCSAEVSTTVSSSFNTFGAQPAAAQQRISIGDIWQQIYQQLPDLPKENTYRAKEGGQVASDNTLVGRIIRYHTYVKGRAPNFRLDWKLTLADYLDANEVMYDYSYPGNDTLRTNPFDGDRTAVKKLTRNQRQALVEALTNAFTK